MERTLKKKISLYLKACFFLLFINTVASEESEDINFGIVIHGGAGSYENLSPKKEKAYKDGVNEALIKGYEILKSGGTSVEAVTEAVSILEDFSLFNAGKGSVYTSKETQEMDASIMNGLNGMAGAVASVSTIKNPIRLARAVMEKSPHVLLVGEGAENFAKQNNIKSVDPSYFHSEKNLQRVRELKKDNKLGTVGAIALDKQGNLAAATSTGGRSNKMPGRVGDSPILGAGTWAENGLCAVSGTGHGEYFMRQLTAAEVCNKMKYLQMSLEDAANAVVERLSKTGAAGGIIALDSKGKMSTPFNTAGMVRGMYSREGGKTIKIYKED